MIALRSIAWAIAWRTFSLSKGGFLLLVERMVSPSVAPITTLKRGSAWICGSASPSWKLGKAWTSPESSAGTAAAASGMMRNSALSSADRFAPVAVGS